MKGKGKPKAPRRLLPPASSAGGSGGEGEAICVPPSPAPDSTPCPHDLARPKTEAKPVLESATGRAPTEDNGALTHNRGRDSITQLTSSWSSWAGGWSSWYGRLQRLPPQQEGALVWPAPGDGRRGRSCCPRRGRPPRIPRPCKPPNRPRRRRT